jgi:hypothetical protein
MSAGPEVVKLRNGAEVPRASVTPILLSLEALAGTDLISLYEAVEVARDRTHEPFGQTGERLTEAGLLERDGAMHGVTRDVILASVAGSGDSLQFVDPYASEEKQA